MPRTPLIESLEGTLVRQQDVVARDQLLAAGINDTTISRRIRDGYWTRLLPGIYCVESRKPSTEQRRIAGALYAGEQAQLTGLAALHWHGFRYAPSTNVVHVLIPHETRRRSTGFVTIQRTRDLDVRTVDVGLYRVVSPARAVIDSCRALGELTVARAVIAEAITRNFTDLVTLDGELRRANRSRTAISRRVIGEIIQGIQSAPESEFRDLLGTSSILPAIVWNPVLTAADGIVLPRPDGYIPQAGIALEVDSRDHHADRDGWARTLQRHNILSRYGLLVLHFTPREIRAEPARVLRVTEQSYLQRMADPPDLQVFARAPSSA